MGISGCVTIQATFFIIYLFKLNWKKVAEEVRDHTLKLHEKKDR